MTINEALLTVTSDVNAMHVGACSILCAWTVVGDEDYLSERDVEGEGDPITDPEGEITLESRQIFARGNRMGTLLGVRMRYSDGLTGITSPVFKIFGRANGLPGNGQNTWQILKSRLGEISVPLTVASTDLVVEGNRATTPDPEAHYFDTQGCNEFLIGVEVELQAETGTIEVAALEVKII